MYGISTHILRHSRESGQSKTDPLFLLPGYRRGELHIMMRKKRMSMVILAVLTIAILLCLNGCSFGDPNDPNMGLYQAVTVLQVIDKEGNTSPVSEEKVRGFSLELGRFQQAVFHVNGKNAKLNWKVKDGVLTLSSWNESAQGTIEDGVIKIPINELVIKFEKVDENQSQPESGETENK